MLIKHSLIIGITVKIDTTIGAYFWDEVYFKLVNKNKLLLPTFFLIIVVNLPFLIIKNPYKVH